MARNATQGTVYTQQHAPEAGRGEWGIRWDDLRWLVVFGFCVWNSMKSVWKSTNTLQILNWWRLAFRGLLLLRALTSRLLELLQGLFCCHMTLPFWIRTVSSFKRLFDLTNSPFDAFLIFQNWSQKSPWLSSHSQFVSSLWDAPQANKLCHDKQSQWLRALCRSWICRFCHRCCRPRYALAKSGYKDFASSWDGADEKLFLGVCDWRN